MKAIVSSELKKRLEFASKNGSVIATDILNELKKENIACFGRKTVNYFDSLRVVGNNVEFKSLQIKITACTKDVNNDNFPDKGNPRAPYFKENREKFSLGTFVSLFMNLGGYTSDEMNYFESAMCVCDKVTYRISRKMDDFEKAYNGSNYYPFAFNGTLHNSCMRGEDTARNAADFYVNFAGAKILIAEDSQGQILGRAIAWDNVIIPEVCDSAKVLDRIYFTFEFIRQGILDYARNTAGIYVRKLKNSVGTAREVFVYPEFSEDTTLHGEHVWSMHIEVPQIKYHKKGAPYMDTFCKLCLDEGKLVLANRDKGYLVASLGSTNGYGSYNRYICPNCGRTHIEEEKLCLDCQEQLIEKTPFGNIFTCKTRVYKKKHYPASFFKDGKPTESFMRFIGVERICNSRCKF